MGSSCSPGLSTRGSQPREGLVPQLTGSSVWAKSQGQPYGLQAPKREGRARTRNRAFPSNSWTLLLNLCSVASDGDIDWEVSGSLWPTVALCQLLSWH